MIFSLGQVVATHGAMDMLRRNGKDPSQYLARHLRCDWGDLDREDIATNAAALNPENPQRLLSAYQVTPTEKIYVITEYDRSVTTILLPEEY